MSKLKELYQLAENDAALKEKLKQADEAVRELPEEKQESTAKETIIKLAAEVGISLQPEDFLDVEGAISDEELEGVAGGKITMGCIFDDAGCTVFGEITSKGGCIILGLH